ncbi:MAG: hypothetical protein F6K19_28220 [Cyanothece sp. SIO1E1]|nr:hypothetical protein [Cyanothece sp. SIO1E1]
MGDENHFGAKRQHLARLLIKTFVFVANSEEKPSGFSCTWEPEKNAIQVVFPRGGRTRLLEFIEEQIDLTEFDSDKLPAKNRLSSEARLAIKNLASLGMAVIESEEEGMGPGKMVFRLIKLPSDSEADCIDAFNRRLEEPISPPPFKERRIFDYPNTVPPSLSFEFVGRETTLDELHEALMSLPENRKLAIADMGGAGKTELCLQYGSKYKRDAKYFKYYKGGICWINVRQGYIADQIISFARSAGYQIDALLSGRQLTEQEKLHILWDIWVNERTLFIYDDIPSSDPEDKRSLPERFPFPPISPRFKILITTRDKELDRQVENFSLERFKVDYGIQLLSEMIWKERLSGGKGYDAKLVEFTGCLPYGIELIGGHLRAEINSEKTLEALYGSLSERRDKWSVMSSEVFAPIAACFEESWVQLDRLDIEVASFIATRPSMNIDAELVDAMFTRTQKRPELGLPEGFHKTGLAKMLRYCLLKSELNNQHKFYYYNPLLKDFVREQLSPEDRERWSRFLRR